MQQPAVPNNPQVLIIEDNEDTRYMLEILLEMRGYQSVAVEDAEKVPALTANRIPDLIIMNITLPVDEGLKTLQQIHEYFSPYNVPIIATSGCALPSFQTAALRAGSSAVFIKPIDFNKLDSLLEQTLSHQPPLQ